LGKTYRFYAARMVKTYSKDATFVRCGQNENCCLKGLFWKKND